MMKDGFKNRGEVYGANSNCFTQKLISKDLLINECKSYLNQKYRLALISAQDYGSECYVSYLFLKSDRDSRVELIVKIDSSDRSVPSLGMLSFPASRFEREINDEFGIVPLGHPFLRPLVRHANWPSDWHPMAHGSSNTPPLVSGQNEFPFVLVEGEGVFEIPVGPVHAGLIEPGHFRFSVVGESIVRMKSRLWYLHKGLEKMFEGKSIFEGLKFSEQISGDSAVAHSLAFVLAVEDCLNVKPNSDVAIERARLLELERVYNHINDIGAMCNDVGYSMANSYAQIIKEELLSLNSKITGHRLLRGKVSYGQETPSCHFYADTIDSVIQKFIDLTNLINDNSNILDRFVGTAILSAEDASSLGVLGIVAKASSITYDARYDHPFASKTPGDKSITEKIGDVFSRYNVRVKEVFESLKFIKDPYGCNNANIQFNSKIYKDIVKSGFGIVEGWRGTVVTRVELDENNLIKRYKIVDPSFLNWPALSVALNETIVPDFPLVNKSFNLSYAGNDL